MVIRNERPGALTDMIDGLQGARLNERDHVLERVLDVLAHNDFIGCIEAGHEYEQSRLGIRPLPTARFGGYG